MVTCGATTDRAGRSRPDAFAKVVDVRVGCRVLNLLQFGDGNGPSAVSFDPRFPARVVLSAQNGVTQSQPALDARSGGGDSGSPFASHRVECPAGAQAISAAISATGEAMAHGDTAGYVYLWSANDDPTCSLEAREPETPPQYPARVDRWFDPDAPRPGRTKPPTSPSRRTTSPRTRRRGC